MRVGKTKGARGGVGVDFQFLIEEVIKIPHRFTRYTQENASGRLGGRIIQIRRMPPSPLDASIDKD